MTNNNKEEKMNFYSISIDEGNRKKYAFGILLSKYSTVINCNSCGREWHETNLLNKEAELTICLSNSYFADFTDVVVFQRLISEKAKEILLNYQITGVSYGNINILSKEQVPPEIRSYC